MKKSIMLVLLLTGCASDKDYTAYLTAQQAANTQAAADQKPLVRITAQPGQNITGLQSLEVYTPTAAPVIQQARPNEWVGVVQTAVGVIGTVGHIRAAGQAAVGIADSVGRAGTAGYAHVQAPAANIATTTTTTTTTDSSTTTSGSYNPATGAVSGDTISGSYNPSTPTSTVGDYSGANSGNAGRIAGSTMADQTSVPTVVTQPAPSVTVQPAAGVADRVCALNALGVLTCL